MAANDFLKIRSSRYKQGIFQPTNPKKYIGDHRHIVYRSSWELKFMAWCDTNPGVISWSSEETVIPYKSPLDNRTHRYFIDFKVKLNTRQGIKTALIEVKPDKQTRPPAQPKKKVTKSYAKEVVTYAVNEAKWDAARGFCKKNGYEFMILNEYDLGIKKKT